MVTGNSRESEAKKLLKESMKQTFCCGCWWIFPGVTQWDTETQLYNWGRFYGGLEASLKT